MKIRMNIQLSSIRVLQGHKLHKKFPWLTLVREGQLEGRCGMEGEFMLSAGGSVPKEVVSSQVGAKLARARNIKVTEW